MRFTLRFIATLGAMAGILLAAVLQSGPDTVETNFCLLTKKFTQTETAQCTSSIGRWGLWAAVVVIFVCAIFLFVDLALWRRKRSNGGPEERSAGSTAPDFVQDQLPSGFSIQLATTSADFGNYYSVCAVRLKNIGNLQTNHCLAEIKEMSGVWPKGMPEPLVLRTEGQVRGKRSGRFILSKGQEKFIPILFARSTRSNEWYFFDEHAQRHFIPAGPIKLILGVYGEGVEPCTALIFVDTDAGWKPFPSLTIVGNDFVLAARSNVAWESLRFRNERISLLETLELAEQNYGWDFKSEHSLHILDFLHGLRQACADLKIVAWGRPNRNSFEALNRNEVLKVIECIHWTDYEFEIWNALETRDNFDAMTVNKRQGSNWKRDGFVDIYFGRDSTVQWLNTDAEQFKGYTRR